MTTLRRVPWAVAAAVCMIGTGSRADDEVHVYGIAKFGGSGQCGSSSMTHEVHTSTAAAFALPFTLLRTAGLWDQVNAVNNTAARGSYWTDSSKATTCACSADDSASGKGVDEADVVYVHTHGSHSATGAGYSSLSMGSSKYTCSARTDQNMFWNSDLDIAVIKACQSGDYDVWAGGGYRQKFTNSDSSLRMWNAFHGDSSCGSHVTSYVSAYAWESFNQGVGENWLDEAYDNSSGADSDDCPVSIVFGSSSSARRNMFENGGWLDRKDTGDRTGSTYFYFAGCDPSHGSKLPSN